MQPSPYKKGVKRVCDPTGWWMSEKLDGFKMRYINGHLFTRSGQELKAPKSFMDLLPKGFDIEGEAYFGKNTFSKTASLRSSSDNTQSWNRMSFHVFDHINYELCWLERQEKLKEVVETNEHLVLVEWTEIKSLHHLETAFARVTKDGGEGLVLADPWGVYEDGHVEQILKYKANKDAEAVVIGYRTEESSYKVGNGGGKRLISLEVHPLNEHTHKPNKKIKFNIGTGLKITDRYVFETKFPIGTVVTYNYELMGTGGKPRTPVFKGIRADVEI